MYTIKKQANQIKVGNDILWNYQNKWEKPMELIARVERVTKLTNHVRVWVEPQIKNGKEDRTNTNQLFNNNQILQVMKYN